MSEVRSNRYANDQTPGIQYVPAHGPIEALNDAMQEDGTLVIDGLLDPNTVEQINRELDPVMTGPTLGMKDAAIVGSGNRLNSSMRHSPTIANTVAAHPVLVQMAEAVLLEHCDTLQLGVTHVSDILAGEAAQPLHRDDFNWGHIKGRTHPLSITTIIALSEFTPATGGTRVIPGSHRWEDAYNASTSREKWKDGIYAEMSYPPGLHEELVVQPVMTPGSAISVLGVTVHSAGANTTVDFCRRGLAIQYCVGWIRATHANLLLYPPDIARNLPEPVQRLLGYQLEAKHCGQLEQGVDPITLLRD